MYNVLANAIVLAHFLFIAFVVCGGLLVIRWPRLAVVHLPAAVWGAVVEIFGWVCPLTPLENHFRLLAGNSSYSGDFIARYLLPVIYPENMTITKQYIFGGIVIFINIIDTLLDNVTLTLPTPPPVPTPEPATMLLLGLGLVGLAGARRKFKK